MHNPTSTTLATAICSLLVDLADSVLVTTSTIMEPVSLPALPLLTNTTTHVWFAQLDRSGMDRNASLLFLPPLPTPPILPILLTPPLLLT